MATSDDDRAAVEQGLKSAGVGDSVRVVHGQQEALAYFRGKGVYTDRTAFPLPGLVFVDIRFRALEGFEVLWWLRRNPRYRKTPVVVITESSLSGEIEWAYASGANSFVVRKTNMELFVRDIRQAVDYWLRRLAPEVDHRQTELAA